MGFACQHGLTAVPDWPKPRLDSEGVMGAINRNMLPLSIADSAFLEARNALGAFDEARLADDPVHSAKILAQAMSFLCHEMGMAGALVALASQQDVGGVEVEVTLPKIAALQQVAVPEPEPGAVADPH